MLNQLNNKIATFFTKIIMLPIIFFFLYSLTLVYSFNIMESINYKVDTFPRFISSVVIASAMSLIITFVLYLIMVILSNKIMVGLIDEEFLKGAPQVQSIIKFISNYLNENNFLKGYHYSHLILFYVSGLITVILTIEPLILQEGLIEKPLDQDWKFSTIILFLAVSNYTLFNSMVLNNDFKIKISRNKEKKI